MFHAVLLGLWDRDWWIRISNKEMGVFESLVFVSRFLSIYNLLSSTKLNVLFYLSKHVLGTGKWSTSILQNSLIFWILSMRLLDRKMLWLWDLLAPSLFSYSAYVYNGKLHNNKFKQSLTLSSKFRQWFGCTS